LKINMEQQETEPFISTPTIPQNQVVAGPVKKTSPAVNKLKEVKEKLSVILGNLPFKSSKVKKVFLIILAIVIVGALVLILVPLAKKLLQKPGEEVPAVTTSQLTLTTKKPSRYATEPKVLNIESEVKAREDELNLVQVKESSLNPPPLNWDVNFE